MRVLDKGVEVADGALVGVEVEADRARITVSRNGLVVVGNSRRVEQT